MNYLDAMETPQSRQLVLGYVSIVRTSWDFYTIIKFEDVRIKAVWIVGEMLKPKPKNQPSNYFEY